jgi:hypothetical protein
MVPGAMNEGQYHFGYQTPDRSSDAPGSWGGGGGGGGGGGAGPPPAAPPPVAVLRLRMFPLRSQAPALISVHASSHIWSISGGSSYGVRSFLNMSSVTTADVSVSGTIPFCTSVSGWIDVKGGW